MVLYLTCFSFRCLIRCLHTYSLLTTESLVHHRKESGGMNGYISLCAGDPCPPIFRSLVEKLEDVMDNQVILGVIISMGERKVIDLDEGWEFMLTWITELKRILEGLPEARFSSE